MLHNPKRVSNRVAMDQNIASQTPYLDRQIPLPRRKPGGAQVKKWQVALFLCSLFVELFRVLIALWMLQILIHELGHLVGGLFVRKRFKHIRVGVFQVDHALNVTWHWTQGDVLSGATTMLPREKLGLGWKQLVFTAAGSLANLLSGFLILKFMPREPSLLVGMCQFFVVGAFFFGIANLLPMRHQGHTLDGLTLWILLFGGHEKSV
jgi:hypothetical protein